MESKVFHRTDSYSLGVLFKYLVSKLEPRQKGEESMNEYQKTIQSKCSIRNQFSRFSAEEMLEQIREKSLNKNVKNHKNIFSLKNQFNVISSFTF